MLRIAIALLAAVVASGTAEAADRAVPRLGWHRAAVMLPPGLPRPHYNFRTSIIYRAAQPAPVYVEEAPFVVLAPVYIGVPYGPPPPYGPYLPYWDRLPYACGGYGIC
jgi:hypothetical protein